MLKKIWFMFVLWSVLMVSGCSSKRTENTERNVVSEIEIFETDVAEDLEADVSLEADIDVIGNSDTSMETEQTQTFDVDKQSSDCSNSGALTKEKPTMDDTTAETDVEPSTTEAPSEPETVTTQPTTPPAKTQLSTPEQTTPIPSTESPATDDRGNPADGSPILEITFNIPEAEYVGYDAEHVARLAVEKCKAAGMILLPENLDRLLAEGKITQEEYNEYYPYDGCGYYSVFVETDLNLASTISGERLCCEEEIADYIDGMMVLEVEPYFYIECAGVYQGNSIEFYEFRCYR